MSRFKHSEFEFYKYGGHFWRNFFNYSQTVYCTFIICLHIKCHAPSSNFPLGLLIAVRKILKEGGHNMVISRSHLFVFYHLINGRKLKAKTLLAIIQKVQSRLRADLLHCRWRKVKVCTSKRCVRFINFNCRQFLNFSGK